MSHEIKIIRHMKARLKKTHRTFEHGVLTRKKDCQPRLVVKK